jgi:plastocyanin
MRPSGILVVAATVSLALLPAGCGSKTNYKGGEVPQAAEGGAREPGTDINSLDELRGVVIRIGPDGFEPKQVVVQAADSVSWLNVDTEEHRVEKIKGQGSDFASRPLGRGQVYRRTFAKPGKVTVRVDTEPETEMVVTVFKR